MGIFKQPEIGCREWVSLPGLGIPHLLAEVDTGTRDACLQAFRIEKFNSNGQLMVGFGIYPIQGSKETELYTEAPFYAERSLTDSDGYTEDCPVIASDIIIGDQQWPIELMLTSRNTMNFCMLLGRTGLQDRFLFVPDASFLTGNVPGDSKQKYKRAEK
jgi:hypothetical protein